MAAVAVFVSRPLSSSDTGTAANRDAREIGAPQAAEPVPQSGKLLRVAVVGFFEELDDFGVNVVERLQWNAVGNPVFLREAACINEAAFGGSISECEAEVDSCVSRRLQIRKDMVAIE